MTWAQTIGRMGDALETPILAARPRAQHPAHGLFGNRMPKQGLNASLNRPGPHRHVSIRKHSDDSPMHDPITKTALPWQRLRRSLGTSA